MRFVVSLLVASLLFATGCAVRPATVRIDIAATPVARVTPTPLPAMSKYTVEDRLQQFGPAAIGRLRPHLQDAGVSSVEERAASLFDERPLLTFLAFKRERRLEVYARGPRDDWRYVRSYPIRAASGGAGPKLREGDGQVPEGVYEVDWLNPNSLFHVSMHVTYPNDFDRAMGRREGRSRLGGDIMIHGGARSVGCLAVGDEAAEDLFTLAASTRAPGQPPRVRVLISPVDFRLDPSPDLRRNLPGWTRDLYGTIKSELRDYPLSPESVQVGLLPDGRASK